MIDLVPLISSAQAADSAILVEGANAIMLDLDHGTYPFVTSSSTGIGGVFSGLGLSPFKVRDIIGVVKAYTTRVGGGPMPTELLDDVGRSLQELGREFGVTTGRRRRCGWLDLVVVKYSTELNYYTSCVFTALEHDASWSSLTYMCAQTKPHETRYPRLIHRDQGRDGLFGRRRGAALLPR